MFADFQRFPGIHRIPQVSSFFSSAWNGVSFIPSTYTVLCFGLVAVGSEWLCECLATDQGQVTTYVPKSIISLNHFCPTYFDEPNKWVKLYFPSKSSPKDPFALFLSVLSSHLNLCISISLLTYSNQTLKG